MLIVTQMILFLSDTVQVQFLLIMYKGSWDTLVKTKKVGITLLNRLICRSRTQKDPKLIVRLVRPQFL